MSADGRENIPILDDGLGFGSAPHQVVEGDAVSGKNGLIGFSFKDSSGNAVTPELDASGNVQISGTVTANAGVDLNTSLLALESGGNLESAATSLAAIDANTDGLEALITATNTKLDTANVSLDIIDDWDEADRAKVNPIVGQAGVQGGSGTVSTNTQRVVLATDVPLPAGTNSIGQVTANAGTNLNTSALSLETTQQTVSTRIGDLTETAPASDTASSGLNGRLQRIAQRITSMIALLPTSLGQKTMANSFAVAIASDQSDVPVSQRASTATLSNVSASATNVTLLSSNTSRKGFKLYNDSNKTAYVKFGETASTTSFTFKMVADSYYEDVIPLYTGQIDALWDTASGTMRITELT